MLVSVCGLIVANHPIMRISYFSSPAKCLNFSSTVVSLACFLHSFVSSARVSVCLSVCLSLATHVCVCVSFAVVTSRVLFFLFDSFACTHTDLLVVLLLAGLAAGWPNKCPSVRSVSVRLSLSLCESCTRRANERKGGERSLARGWGERIFIFGRQQPRRLRRRRLASRRQRWLVCVSLFATHTGLCAKMGESRSPPSVAAEFIQLRDIVNRPRGSAKESATAPLSRPSRLARPAATRRRTSHTTNDDAVPPPTPPARQISRPARPLS